MDQYTDELEHTLPEEARRHPATWAKENLRQIAADLLAEPGRYKLFGAYWWGVKHLLRHSGVGPRGAWFRGPYADEAVRGLADHGQPALNLHAALRRVRAWDDGPEWLDRPEADLGICEWSDGQVEMYRLSDTDCGHQLDLFDAADRQEHRRRHYLQTVTEYLPRTWRSHGDRALEDGNPGRAAVCYQRMIHLATSRTDRSEAWLLLGMTYDQMGHFPKAVFCYQNLYEKENEHWILGNIANSHYQAGRIRDAIACYEQALKLMPGNPEFAAGLEAARLKLGRGRPEPGDFRQLELAHA
jgi:tetratricopeptide (TPR) repeat protein